MVFLISLICCDSSSGSQDNAWSRHQGPVFTGYYAAWGGFAADACVYKAGSAYVMYYTDLVINDPDDKSDDRAGIALATSPDGISFSPVDTSPGNAVIERTPDSYDEDAVFSPHVLYHGGTYYMIYSGHWWNDPSGSDPSGVFVLGATSADGLSWVKHSEPVLLPALWRDPSDPASGYDWMRGIVGEASFFPGPDGFFYLFFQGDGPDGKMRIGLARAAHPFGPYTIKPDPILEPVPGTFDELGVIAPHALYDNGLVRLYYNGLRYETDTAGNTIERWLLGYAEKRWPIW